MAPSIEWKQLKKVIAGQNAIKNLKSLDPKSLKNLESAHGKNLLHVAAKHAFLDICKYLVKAGLDMNLEEKKNGHTPLSYALNCKDKKSSKIIDLLVKSGADVSWNKIKFHSSILFAEKKFSNALCSSLVSREGGYKEAIQHLTVNSGWTFDNIACLQNESLTRYAFKIDDGLNANYEKLKEAINKQDVSQVKFLLQSVSHSKRILSWLLSHTAKIRSLESPLIIKMLLDCGAPVDGFPCDKKTPLTEALINRNVNNSWILLNHSAKLKKCKIPYYYTIVIMPEERKLERVFAKNCIRLIVEHWGVCCDKDPCLDIPKNWIEFYRSKLGIDISYHICVEYKLMQRHLKEIDYSDVLDKYCCSEELKRIKDYKIEEFSISLWDILKKTIDEVVPFTRNNYLMDEINADSFIFKFPLYGKTIQFKMNKASEKRLQTELSIDVLRKCLPRVGSCDLVVEKIVDYLGIPNLLGAEQSN